MLPCSATLSPTRRLASRDVGGPVQPQGITAGGGDLLQPLAAVLGEQGDRHAAALVLADQAVDDLAACTAGRSRGKPRAVSTPPQVSNTMTAWAPALIWALR